MNDEDYIDDFIREDSIETEETADEMFEELGYRIMFDNTCMFRYVKCF